MTWEDQRGALKDTAEWLSGQTEYWGSFRVNRKDKPEPLAHLMGWLKHEGHCVYCGKNLVGDAETLRHAATTDHLLPKGEYPELDSDPLNAVPACGVCNSLKRAYDPNKHLGVYRKGSGCLTPEQQERLIEDVKESCLKTKTAERDSNFEDNFNSWKEALERLKPR